MFRFTKFGFYIYIPSLVLCSIKLFIHMVLPVLIGKDGKKTKVDLVKRTLVQWVFDATERKAKGPPGTRIVGVRF